MKIQQFEYKPLSHFSYALISEGEMAIIDPGRNPMQYYEMAQDEKAQIKAVILTHSHADFISSHVQISKETGATIYHSKKLNAQYPHQVFDGRDKIKIGQINLAAINTPGHSHDSITVVVKNNGQTVLFTGDTLFVGDVGRPDLRGDEKNKAEIRQELAKAMYCTLQEKFSDLPDDSVVYPAHGEGSLCGKNISSAKSTTLGKERIQNWAFKELNEERFVEELLDAQPFIPAYFEHAVKMNKRDIETVQMAVAKVPLKLSVPMSDITSPIIDGRDEADYKKNHLEGSINIMALNKEGPFETWLGTILEPDEEFYLVIDSPRNKEFSLDRLANIGYENNVVAITTLTKNGLMKSEPFKLSDFKNHHDDYTIVDVRTAEEFKKGKIFENAINKPLHDLRSTAQSVPTDKPIVVHCASGYRSAIGSSILSNKLREIKVYDLGAHIKEFK